MTLSPTTTLYFAAAIRDGQGVYIPGADQYPLRAPERNILAENGPLAYTD